jgi:hypothetical protein
MLWRVVFCDSRPDQPHLAGPWHPDKTRIQAWVDWFRSTGQCARLQSSAEAGKLMSGGSSMTRSS